MNIIDFPTKDKVISSIERLNAIDFPKYKGKTNVDSFVENITKMLTSEFGIILNTLKPFKQKDFKLSIFRVREMDSFSNINLVREHSYPPIHLTGMGRCNFPQFPVFYCSNDAMTALIEVVRNYVGSEKKYCISKWEIHPTDQELVFETFLQSELPVENHFKIFQKEIQERINEPFEKSFQEKLAPEKKDGLIEYLTYLDKSFINDKNYSISASLAHRSLYAGHNFRTDILMYPSVQTQFKGVNMALSPNFVENNLELKRLYEVTLDNYNPEKGEVKMTFHQYAEVEKNVIMWKRILTNDDTYNQTVKEDFGQYIKSNFKKKE